MAGPFLITYLRFSPCVFSADGLYFYQTNHKERIGYDQAHYRNLF